MEAGKVMAISRVDDLALELLHVKFYIHSTLDMKYGGEDDKPSKRQRAFCRLQIELVEREEALKVATAKVGTLQALLETERQSFAPDPAMERELVRL